FGIGREGRYFFGARRFFIGYSVSVLVMAPLLLLAFCAPRRRQIAAFFRSIEGWLIVAAIAASVAWVFLHDELRHAQNLYMLFLPLVWAATRFGMVGGSIALVLIQLGLFLQFFLANYQPLSVFELQLVMIALAITGLLLGVTIDEWRRATDEVRESLKLAAAGEMSAAIAHEINQPLTALAGYATAGKLIAAALAPDHAQLADTMAKLQVEVQRTAAVVQRLREFFRSGATQLEQVSLAEQAELVFASLNSKAQAARVRLNVHAAPGVPAAMVDALQIEVVLRNLIANAIESAAESAEPGRVDVTIEPYTGNQVLVQVHDSGAGISEADRERLFDSFVTTKSTGMGMGLAISRAMINAHGGRIWAVPGKRGLLCFVLPTDAASEAKIN
ncbi:MAG: hypothetical protein FJY56_01640, partial [Betaproteobacteria bacterium]|nr:hypothetical protein [Betaproteobacteria bacterium]